MDVWAPPLAWATTNGDAGKHQAMEYADGATRERSTYADPGAELADDHGWARSKRLWLKALLAHVQAKMVMDGGI